MRLTIISRKHKKEFFFIRPGASYIPVEIEEGARGRYGQRRQICHGGGLRGSTVSYVGDDQEAFNRVCRAWYRAWMRREGGEA